MLNKAKALILVCLFSLTLSAQKYKSINVKVDTTFFGIKDEVELTVSLVKKSGKVVYLQFGDIYSNWNKIKISGNFYSSFSEGILKYKASGMNASHHTLSLTVTDKKETISQHLTIDVPYVKAIRLYLDSFVVNKPSNLNYDLVFSNGKTCGNKATMFNPSDLIVESDFPISIKEGKVLISAMGFLPYERLPVKFKHRYSGATLAEAEIPIRYPKSVEIDFSGNNGTNGMNGNDGVNYSDHGTSGQSGSNGQNAPLVKVFIEQQKLNERVFLTITAFSSDYRRVNEVIEFKGRNISITARGGNGGNGGNGGGGRSGLIDKEKKIDSPYGGNAGHGGNAGLGGNGGQVVVFMDSSLVWLNKYIVMDTEGGKPGLIGKEGQPGNGNYENSYLLGMLLSTKRGTAGKPGQNGNPGYNGNSGQIILLSNEEVKEEFKKCAKGNL